MQKLSVTEALMINTGGRGGNNGGNGTYTLCVLGVVFKRHRKSEKKKPA